MRRAIPLAALAAIAILLFARPIVRNEVLVLRDHSDYFQPLRLFTCQELRRGHLPLWNPYNASGEPWLANPQTGVFYPPAWIFVVVPFARAYTLFLAFHVALLGCGAFALLQRLASPAGAFLGALTLMLSGPALSLLDVSNTLTTFAWIPLVLWSALAGRRTLAAVFIALCFLAGEPFFAALAAGMWLILECCRSPRSATRIADVALTSFALTAVQLLPFLAWIRNSDRAGHAVAGEVLRNSFPPAAWLHVFIGGAAQQEFVPVVYVGLVASVLAACALVLAWRRRAVRFSVALLAFAAFIAAGCYLAPVRYLLTRGPITFMRYPARMIPIGALAIAVLCAAGWDSVARRMPYGWLPLVLAAVIVADLVPKIAPLMESAPFDPHPTPYDVFSGRDSKLIRLLRRRWVDRGAWIAGYMNLFDRRFDSWTAAPVVSAAYVRAYGQALRDPLVRNAMSIGYLLSDESGSIRIYRNPSARPLAYWRGGDGAIAGPSLLALTTTAFHITIDAPRDGVVVVTQQNSSAWRVRVDDAPAERLPDELFCAVRVTRGRHDIAWRYRPSSLWIGAIITAIGILRVALSQNFVKHGAKKVFFTTHLQASSSDVESRSSTFSVLVLEADNTWSAASMID